MPPSKSYGFQMIRSIQIKNFRCYQSLNLRDCARLNVLVGDNGSGKTSLLEALFLTLAASPEVAVRLRQLRGLENAFGGTIRRIEQGLWGDFFYNSDMSVPISIKLTGDGPEARSLEIARAAEEAVLPFDSDKGQPTVSQPIVFDWTDSEGVKHSSTPKVSPNGLTLPGTGENIPDFFFVASAGHLSPADTAARFSDLSMRNDARRFVRTFTAEYTDIKDLNVEVHAGAPVLFATLKNNRKLPVANISSGVTRILNIMLLISEKERGVILVDEIENGVYYTHLESIWKIIIALLREHSSQMFVTTHSKECLEALMRAAGDKYNDISLWRTEQSDRGRFIIRQFSGEDFMAGIEYGQEVR